MRKNYETDIQLNLAITNWINQWRCQPPRSGGRGDAEKVINEKLKLLYFRTALLKNNYETDIQLHLAITHWTNSRI